MSTVVIEEQVRIPTWVLDLESFRRWARSDDFPERGRFSHLKGELWVDLSMEKLSHNQIKGVFAIVVGGWINKRRLGYYFHDRMLLTNLLAALSTEPDGMFSSFESIREGRVVLEKGADEIEVQGSPDMVLEVISPKSVQKDTVVLPELYWQAGVQEYWLVDGRGERLIFDVFRHTPKGYVATRKQAGWLKSALFGKSFKLTKQLDPMGNPEYQLAMR